MQIRKAQRQQTPLRIALSGASGSGKTLSSLYLAYGIIGDWSKICVIDTENKRADMYSDLGEYNVLNLEAPYSPERYIEAIRTAERAGMAIIILDSISHEWEGTGGALDLHSKLPDYNTYTAWAKITPRHKAFIEAIIQSPCHVISTLRCKTEYALELNDKGRQTPKKIGLKAIQREGFDYENLIYFELSQEHVATATKDNTGLFDLNPVKISIIEGAKIKEWLLKGHSKKEIINLDDIINNIKNTKNKIELDQLIKTLNNDFSFTDQQKIELNNIYKTLFINL